MINFNILSRNKKTAILKYFSQSSSIGLTLNEIKDFSSKFSKSIISRENEEAGCGDYFYILIIVDENDMVCNFFYCSEECCMLSSALAYVFYYYSFGKKINYVKELIDNFDKLIIGKKYDFVKFSKLVVFEDIVKFPNKIGCLNMIRNSVFDSVNL